MSDAKASAAAALLGARSRGKRKRLSEEQRAQRRELMKAINERRAARLASARSAVNNEQRKEKS